MSQSSAFHLDSDDEKENVPIGRKKSKTFVLSETKPVLKWTTEKGDSSTALSVIPPMSEKIDLYEIFYYIYSFIIFGYIC